MSQNTNKDNFNKGLKEIASGVSFIGDNLSLAAKKTQDSKKSFFQSRWKAKNRDIPALPPPNEFDPPSDSEDDDDYDGNPQFGIGGRRKKTKRRRKKTKRRRKKTKRRRKKTKRRTRKRRS